MFTTHRYFFAPFQLYLLSFVILFFGYALGGLILRSSTEDRWKFILLFVGLTVFICYVFMNPNVMGCTPDTPCLPEF